MCNPLKILEKKRVEVTNKVNSKVQSKKEKKNSCLGEELTKKVDSPSVKTFIFILLDFFCFIFHNNVNHYAAQIMSERKFTKNLAKVSASQLRETVSLVVRNSTSLVSSSCLFPLNTKEGWLRLQRDIV